MRSVSKSLVAGTVVLSVFSEASGSPSTGRPIVKGQIQDVFFLNGTTATKNVPYKYQNMGPGLGSPAQFEGIVAGPLSPGVAVISTYGQTGLEAFYPNVAPVGPASVQGVEKNEMIQVKITPSASVGTHTIVLYADTVEGGCMQSPMCQNTDPSLIEIGRLNVYNVYPFYETAFTITGSGSNIVGSELRIDHPFTDNNFDAILLVSHNWNPNGVGGVSNNHPVGVTYHSGKWHIRNLDGAAMPTGVSFNVRIEAAYGNSAGFIQVTTATNSTGHYTLIDNPVSNNNPYANVFVTRNETGCHDPVSCPIVIDFTRNIGVAYLSIYGRWAIFTEDGSTMPLGLFFNVRIHGQPGGRTSGFVFTHEVFVQSGNVTGHATFINRASTNHSSAILIFTPNWNPNGIGGTWNDRVTGLFWSGGNWAIYNQNSAAMPGSAAFNVWEPYPNL